MNHDLSGLSCRSLLLALCLGACAETPAVTPRDASGADARDAAEVAPPADVTAPTVRDLPEAVVPASRLIEPGVRREAFRVATPPAPPNPAGMVATPAALNAVQVIRYRTDATPPAAVRAVVVAMPGFLGGAASLDGIARTLVRRAHAAGNDVEVWAIDRRANLLEDLRGMSAADAMNDPEIAAGYYLDQNVRLGGHEFAGFLEPGDRAQAYMSEWGLATVLNDLRAVISLVPAPRDHVVLVGHSLGASIVEAYAAWDFDGEPGYRGLAGLALVDGVHGGQSVTESAYMNGGGAVAGFPAPGLTALRQSGPFYTALPALGVQALAISEIVARRAARAPDEVVPDRYRDRVFRLLLGLPTVPPMTNAAAFGFALDDASCPLAFAQMSLGAPTGGALMMQSNPFGGGRLSVPASATARYAWVDAPSATPREFTSIATGAAAWSATPSNFAEWYFSTRLTIDVTALGDMRNGADSWQRRVGLRASHGGEIDLPVLGVAAALVGRASAFDGVRARLTATVGEGRPNAGATRSADAGFRAIFVPMMTHIDAIAATDANPENPVPEALGGFVASNTRGTVTPTVSGL